MSEPTLDIPLISVLPFAILLLCIAALPLAAPHFWEKNRNKALVAAVLAAPITIWLLRTEPHALLHTAKEYLAFIALLGSLFVVAGGIHLGGDLRASPRNNTLILGVGGILASVIGTTGASMVLIRLLLRTNQERDNTSHLPLFFILIVSNCGGLLTPLGDPPLFLGYLRGVPFFWTLRLWPVWVLVLGYLLAVFYWLDRRAYARETPLALRADEVAATPLRVQGSLNVLLLLGIVIAVFFPTPWRELSMLALSVISVVFGAKAPRRKNEFTFSPIIEVAVLFIGIFVTMVPALELLRAHGAQLGLREPWQFFLVTGSLSSVLDNAPTYLTFLSAAQGLGLPADLVGVTTHHLTAISVGAVLMGANTYIGNGPNFMVKAIAEEAGYKTFDFVRYAGLATALLAPVYALIVLWLRAG